MKRARDYRKNARDLLGNNIFSDKWIYCMLIVLIVSAILGIFSGATTRIHRWIGPMVGSIISILISGPLSFGLVRVYLRFVRGEDEKADIARLVDGFSSKFMESFVLSLLVFLYTFLWSLLFVIPGIIKSYSYSASMYLLHEKNLEGNDAIDESRKLMDGNKWRLFCLDLSFIGWYIVGLLCLGVGVFWVQAYHNTARTKFFDELLSGQPNVIDIESKAL